MNKQTETVTEFIIKENNLKQFLFENLSNCESNPTKRDVENMVSHPMLLRLFETPPFYLLQDNLFIKKTETFPIGSNILIKFNYWNAYKEPRIKKSHHYLKYEYTYKVLPYDSMCNEMRLVGFDVIPVIENQELCPQREQ